MFLSGRGRAACTAKAEDPMTSYSFTEKKRIRKDFGKQSSILEVPFLLAIQVDSYREFLQADRDSYTGVKAYYYEINSAEKKEAIAGGGDNCVRLLPPLNLTLDEAREAVARFEAACEVAREKLAA